jgi:hypothetical protein
VDRLHYFHLHADTALACASCRDRTCVCPQELDLPGELARAHATLLALRERGLLPRSETPLGDGVRVRVVWSELPVTAARGALCRFWIENAGERPWARAADDPEHVALEVRCEGQLVERVRLREDVHPGMRTHVALALERPRGGATYAFALAGRGASTEIARAALARGAEP